MSKGWNCGAQAVRTGSREERESEGEICEMGEIKESFLEEGAKH